MGCPHLNFNAYVAVNRIHRDGGAPDDIVAYTADIKVACRECGQPFEFFGFPCGMSFYQATVSIDGQELRVPLVLPGTEPPPGLAGFKVSFQEFPGGEVVKQ